MNNNLLSNLLDKLVSPVLTNQKTFIVLILLFIAPALTLRITLYSKFILGTIFHMSYITAYSITYAYGICVVLTFIKEPIKKYISGFIVFLIWLISAIEIYVIIFVHNRFTPLILQLVLETNSKESSEYLSTFLIKTPALIYLSIISLSFFTLIFSLFKWGKHFVIKNKYFKTFVNALLFYSISVTLLCSIQNIMELQELTPLDTLIYSIKENSNAYQDVKKLKHVSAGIKTPITDNSSDIESIVVIIGESFSKHHSSLYGYHRKTNPILENLQKNGNLFVFTDVVTPQNLTSEVFKYILSFKSQDDSTYWADNPLFPTIFKKAGWESIFISNQIVKQDGKPWELHMRSYLNNKVIEEQSFSERNKKLRQYDIELTEDYDSIKKNPTSKHLVIFHLMGQHLKYSERYPKQFSYFTIDSIERNDLKTVHQQEIADYDNATRYNDYVISEIIKRFNEKDAIVIYFSDHGEEVNDYRIQLERTQEPVITKNIARYQYEIPFIIWVSDTFKIRHPEIIENIEYSVDRPFMTDDIPHLLIDISGIQTQWFDPSRSIINDEFNLHRKRLLRDGQDYNEIIKQP